MKDISDEIQHINVANDIGVSFGHISKQYNESILKKGTGARILDNKYYDSLEVSNEENSWFDPMARELFVPKQYDSILRNSKSNIKNKFIESEIFVHEATHNRLTNRERQFFEIPFIDSFIISLRIALGNSQNNLLIEHIKDTIEMIRGTTLVQEAFALREQRYYLKQECGISKDKIYDILYHGSDIEERISPGDNTEDGISATHSLADWLYSQVRNTWDIDILSESFLFAVKNPSHESQDLYGEKILTVPPNSVLIEAALADTNEISNCDTTKQRKILAEKVSNLHPSENLIYLGVQNKCPNKLISRQKKSFLNNTLGKSIQSVVDIGMYQYIPLYATNYPSRVENKTLLNLLRSMYSVQTGQNERKILIGEDSYSWASGTEILKIAIELWKLRRDNYIPILQRIVPEYQHDWETCKYIAENVDSGGLDPNRNARSEMQISDNIILDHQTHDSSIPPEKIQKSLLNLGKAILSKDEQKLKKFY